MALAEEEVLIPDLTLKTRWDSWYPYAYQRKENGTTPLTGLDIQLIETLAKQSKNKVDFNKMPWSQSLMALKEGTIDLAFGATFSDERAEYVYFSKPYRYEENSLFMRRDRNNLNVPTHSIFALIEYIKKNNFRLGVISNILYADPLLNQFISDPLNHNNIVYMKDEYEGLNKVLNKEIDGFLADRIVGSSIVWRAKKGEVVSEHFLNISVPIHLMFSKKTVSKEVVQAFNLAIDNLQNKESYKHIVSWYLYPVILLQTVTTHWFFFIDLLGTVFFSISGVLIANSKKSSLLSAFIYAMLPSLTGGLLRDVIFGHRPADTLTTPIFLLTVILTVIVGFIVVNILDFLNQGEKTQPQKIIFKKIFKHFKLLLAICDALGLAAFTVTGVIISIMAKVEPLWLWGPFFSFVTGASGTIIRDILSKRKKIADIKGEIYSEVAIVWGLFLSLGLLYNTYDIRPALIQNLVIITLIGAFLTRMAVYYFKVPNVYFK